MTPLSSDDDDSDMMRYFWKNITVSPTVAIISSVVILFILDIPWWRQLMRKVYAFLTEGKRKRKELEETKLLLQLAREESESQQKELQELEQQLKATEEKLSLTEGQLQEEERKTASLEAQVAFLQQLSKTEQEKMESQLAELTEKKDGLEEELKELHGQCLELVSLVKNRGVPKGPEDEETCAQGSPEESEEGESRVRETLERLSALIVDSFQKDTKEKQELAQQIVSLREQNSSAKTEMAQLSEKLKASEKQAKILMQELTKERQQAKEAQRAHEKSMDEVNQEKEQIAKKLNAATEHNSVLEAQVTEYRRRVMDVRDEMLVRNQYDLEAVVHEKDGQIANVQKEMEKQNRIEAIFIKLLLQELSAVKPDEPVSASWKNTLGSMIAKCKAEATVQYDSELLQGGQGNRMFFRRQPVALAPKQPQDDLVTQSTPASPTEPMIFGGFLQSHNPTFQVPTKTLRRPHRRQSLGALM